LRHPAVSARWHRHSNHLIYLSVADEAALSQLSARLLAEGLLVAEFYEPDLEKALTAIAVEPSSRLRSHCGGLPLCLKEYLSLAPGSSHSANGPTCEEEGEGAENAEKCQRLPASPSSSDLKKIRPQTLIYSPQIQHVMNKYHRLREELESKGTGQMKCFGNSMLPILKSGSLLTFRKQPDYAVGDIVFCKVKGRFIDAHKIVKVHPHRGYLIANNHGHENGWTRTIYGRAVAAKFNHKTKEL
jgi:hypothetical protein